MSEIPKAAVEAFIAAMGSEDPPSWLRLSGPMQESIAKRVINAALPHLDSYAAGFAAGQEAMKEAAAKAVCAGCAHDVPLRYRGIEPYGFWVHDIEGTENGHGPRCDSVAIRSLPIAPAPEQPDDPATRLADAYQIVGALADAAGVMDAPEVQAVAAAAAKAPPIPGEKPKPVTVEEGDVCPECGDGRMEYERDGSCSCYINPPCSSCVEAKLTCTVCS